MRFLERFRREKDIIWEQRTLFLMEPRGGTYTDGRLLNKFKEEMFKNPYFELRNPNGILVFFTAGVYLDYVRLPIEGKESQEKLGKIIEVLSEKDVSIDRVARMFIGKNVPDVVTFKFPRPIIEFLQSLWTQSNS